MPPATQVKVGSDQKIQRLAVHLAGRYASCISSCLEDIPEDAVELLGKCCDDQELTRYLNSLGVTTGAHCSALREALRIIVNASKMYDRPTLIESVRAYIAKV